LYEKRENVMLVILPENSPYFLGYKGFTLNVLPVSVDENFHQITNQHHTSSASVTSCENAHSRFIVLTKPIVVITWKYPWSMKKDELFEIREAVKRLFS
jgi:hypothetical protein